MLGILAMGVVRESRKFLGHPCRPIGRIARSFLRQHSFLVKHFYCIVFDRFLCLYVCIFLSFFVSLLARLRENGWTDLRETFREGVE